MAKKLTHESLWGLEQYAAKRDAFRLEVIAHKKRRRLSLGPHVSLLFEDFKTMQYQVQEMLRTERIFEAPGIEEELAAYNPLIPDGRNWKATMLIEYPNVEQRRAALAQLVGVEDSLWAQIAGCNRITAIANEDMPRSTADKTAAVHFLRFELDPVSIDALHAGASLAMGVDHPQLNYKVDPLDVAIHAALRSDIEQL